MQTVAEMPTFTKHAEKLLTVGERKELIDFMAANPQAGAIMPRCGGFRKVRWSRQGSGKSGGVRVIYYLYDENHPLLLTMVYSKNERDNLTAEQQNKLAAFASDIKEAWKGYDNAQ